MRKVQRNNLPSCCVNLSQIYFWRQSNCPNFKQTSKAVELILWIYWKTTISQYIWQGF